MDVRLVIPEITIRLPEWVEGFLAGSSPVLASAEDRMRLVIGLARQNVRQRTGGPFAAVVFDASGRLVAPGVNMVTSRNLSALHAEMVALSLAQQVLGRYDLSDGGRLSYDLYSAAEPCAMCFGAILWAGVRGFVCGARSEDAAAIGFDEGPKVSDWVSSLAARNISVTRDVLRADAAAVMQEYVASGGLIYNPGRMGPG
jgi:tRNA(Arg) A34 adenosine deaminase TadA